MPITNTTSASVFVGCALRAARSRLTKRAGGGKPLIELHSIVLAQLECNYPLDGASRDFARCSWNRNDVRRQGEQPGQCNFLRCSAMPCRDPGQHKIPRYP